MAALVATVLYEAPTFAQQGPSQLNISGSLLNSTGQPITSSNVRFKIDVYDKDATCLMYSEQHTGVDLSNTRGAFSLIIGSGTSAVNNLEGTTAFDSKIFENPGAVAPFTGCGSGLTLSPGDTRLIRVSYDIGGGLVAMTPDIPITSSAYAMVAESLQGKSAADFIMTNVNTSLSQANVDYIFSNVNYLNLKALVDGTSTQYIVTNPSAAVGFNGQRLINVGTPTGANDAANKSYVDGSMGGKGIDFSAVGPGIGGGRTIVWDQTQNKWVTSATGSVGLVAAGTGLTGGNITASGTLSVDVGVTANKILQLDASARIPAVDGSLLTNVNAMFLQGRMVSVGTPSALQVLGWNAVSSMWEPQTPTGGTVTGLSGDVSGSGAGVISTTIQPNAVTSAKINNIGVAVNRLLITDSTSGTTVGYATCGLNEVMQWTATGWACKSVALLLGNSGVTPDTYGNSIQVPQIGVDASGRVVSLTNVNIDFPVISVAGRTGAVTLTATDVGGLGTAATKNVGTGLNNVLQFTTAGQLPAVDGSLLTNINANATSLQGTAVSATPPSAGQVLAFNNLTSQWEASPASSGSVTAVVAGTGLTGGTINSTGTLSVDVGITANKIVQLDSNARLPAVDGSLLTNLSVASSQWLTNSPNIYYNLGNVGIGTATPVGYGAGGPILGIRGTASTLPEISLDATPFGGSNWVTVSDNNGNFYFRNVTTNNTPITLHGNSIVDIDRIAVGSYAGTAPPLNGMIIPGNVGIGTTTPGYKLDVAGTINASSILVNGVAVGTGSGSVSNVTAGTGLTGGSITAAGTLNVDVGVTANKILQLDANAQIPAVDGSQLTNVNASKIGGYAIATTSPAPGQYIGWNNTTSRWEPTATTAGTVTNITAGTGLTGGSISSTGTLAVDVGITANKIVQLDSSARLPAVDGSLLTNLAVASSQWSTNSPNIYYNLGSVGIGTAAPGAALEVSEPGFGGAQIRTSNNSWTRTSGVDFYATTTQAGFVGYRGVGSAGTSDTGLWLAAWDPMPIIFGTTATPGTPDERMRITETGNVGVGTTTPNYKLDVAGTINASSVLVNGVAVGTGSGSVSNVTAGTGLTGGSITTNGTLNVDVGITANKIVQLDSNARLPAVDGSQLTNLSVASSQWLTNSPNIYYNLGNVGIGTSAPTELLTLVKNQPSATAISVTNTSITSGASSALNLTAGASSVVLGQMSQNTAWADIDAGEAYLMSGGNGMVFYNNSGTGQQRFVNGSTEVMRLISNGNVGIGTATPQALLDIQTTTSGRSAILIPRDTTANRPAGVNGMIRYNTTLGQFEGFASGAWGGLAGVGTTSSPFQLNGTKAYYNGGNVGIGTSAPTTKLDVNGTAHFAGNVDGDGYISAASLTGIHGTATVYASTSSSAVTPDGSVINSWNISTTDGVAATLNMTTTNASSKTQVAYLAAVSNTGGSNYTPSIVIGQQTGANAYAERMRIDTNGYVGIGTASPVDLLSLGAVNASATHASLNLSNTALSGASASGTYIGANPASASADFINYQVGGTTKFKVDKNGKVTGDGSGLTGISASPAGSNTQVQFNNSGSMGASSNLVWDNANGRLGIGTTSPGQKLTVNGRIETKGGILFNQGSAATDNLMYLASASSGAVNASMGFFAAGAGSGNAAQGPYFLARGNTFSDIGGQRGNIMFYAGNPSSPAAGEGSITFSTGAEYARMKITNDGVIQMGNLAQTPSNYPVEVGLDTGFAFFTTAVAGVPEVLYLNNGATTAVGNGSSLTFSASSTNSSSVPMATVSAVTTDNGASTFKGDLVLSTSNNNSLSEKMRVTSAGKVGIGTASPGAPLEVNPGNMFLTRTINDAFGASLIFRKSHSAIVQNGDELGYLRFDGYDGAAYKPGANIGVIVDGTPGTNDMPGAMIFSTTPDGASALSERMRITSAGNVGIGTASPRAALDVNGVVLMKPAVSNAASTIDFSNGNIQYTTASCGNFQLNNLKDGGSYTFIVQGSTSALCAFTAYSDAGSTALTVHMPPGHTSTTAGTHTLYSLLVAGTHLYVSWIPGY